MAATGTPSTTCFISRSIRRSIRDDPAARKSAGPPANPQAQRRRVRRGAGQHRRQGGGRSRHARRAVGAAGPAGRAGAAHHPRRVRRNLRRRLLRPRPRQYGPRVMDWLVTSLASLLPWLAGVGAALAAVWGLLWRERRQGRAEGRAEATAQQRRAADDQEQRAREAEGRVDRLGSDAVRDGLRRDWTRR